MAIRSDDLVITDMVYAPIFRLVGNHQVNGTRAAAYGAPVNDWCIWQERP